MENMNFCKFCFYLLRQHTVSIDTVFGNISTGQTFSSLYPPSHRYRRSRARVALSQLTYTTRLGFIFRIVSRRWASHPFLGGSTTITSAYVPFFSYSLGSTSSAFPTKNSRFSIWFSFAFSLALSMAPQLFQFLYY